MKKLVINEQCVGCGVCFDMTDLIIENDEGFAVVAEQTYLDTERMEALQKVMQTCPNHAIEIVDEGLVQEVGAAGINELYRLIAKEMKSFQVTLPDPKGYHFKKEDYKYPITQSAKSFRFEYKNDSRAESAGLREFERVMYSQRRAIIQGILVEYKSKHLKEFYEPQKKAGDYYFEQNRMAQELISKYINEALSLTEGKLVLPEDISTFYVEPDFGYEGFCNIARLKELEDVDYTGSIVNELEPLQWFCSWIDTDYQENARGKDVYCFNSMTEVSVMFGDQILTECGYVLNGERDIDRDVNLAVDIFGKDLYKMVQSKLKTSLDALAEYMKESGIEIEETVEEVQNNSSETDGSIGSIVGMISKGSTLSGLFR